MNRITALGTTILCLLAGPALADIAIVDETPISEGGTEAVTAGAGANRVQLSITAAEDISVAFAPTIGGVGLTDVGSDPFGDGAATDRQAYSGYLLEAAIQAGSQAYVQGETGSTGSPIWRGSVFTLSGVHQTMTVVDVDEKAHGNGMTWTSNAFDVVEGGMAFCIASLASAHDVGADGVNEAGWADIEDWNATGWSGVIASKAITADGTETVDFSWSDNETGVTQCFSLAPAATGNPLRRRRS